MACEDTVRTPFQHDFLQGLSKTEMYTRITDAFRLRMAATNARWPTAMLEQDWKTYCTIDYLQDERDQIWLGQVPWTPANTLELLAFVLSADYTHNIYIMVDGKDINKRYGNNYMAILLLVFGCLKHADILWPSLWGFEHTVLVRKAVEAGVLMIRNERETSEMLAIKLRSMKITKEQHERSRKAEVKNK
jgi:hypothetical protein